MEARARAHWQRVFALLAGGLDGFLRGVMMMVSGG
jgi:hypothetical protein